MREIAALALLARRKEDFGARNHNLKEIRGIIHNKTLTLQPPPTMLYGQAEAFWFPALPAVSLAGAEARLAKDGLLAGKATLLGFSSSQMSMGMVDGWLNGAATLLGGGDGDGDGDAAVPAAAADPPPLQTLRMSLVDNAFVGLLRRPLLASMRMSVPAEQHASFYCYFGDTTAFRTKMGMENKYLGYVCLVDPDGVVRWHVHGSELPAEGDLDAASGGAV